MRLCACAGAWLLMFFSGMCLCERVCARVFVHVRLCICACLCVFDRACVCVSVRMCACVGAVRVRVSVWV
jgi:hypothetical protein